MLEAAGAEVHLAHPLGVRAYSCRRVKNDQRDAADLAGTAADGQAAGGVDRPAGAAARDLLRALDGVTGPDEPETRETLRDVAAAIEARRGDWPPDD